MVNHVQAADGLVARRLVRDALRRRRPRAHKRAGAPRLAYQSHEIADAEPARVADLDRGCGDKCNLNELPDGTDVSETTSSYYPERHCG
jgi:hypothetical protein